MINIEIQISGACKISYFFGLDYDLSGINLTETSGMCTYKISF